MVIRYANLVPVFFDTYSGTLGRSRFWILRYLQWYAAPIWFWRFFDICRNILYQSGISGQDAQSASVTCSVFFLSVGSVSQRKVASLSPSTLTKPQQHPQLHLNPDRCHLPLAFPSPSPHKTSTASTTPSTPGPIPPSSGVPLSIPTKKRHPAVPTLPDTGTKTPVKQTYTIYNQHSLSAQLNYHQKVLSATQDRWPAL